VKKLKGPVGTTVIVKFAHAGSSQPQNVDLERNLVRMETVLGDRRRADDTWQWLYDKQQKIAYVRITSFGRHTVEELRAVMQQLAQEKIAGLVLDLRFNPGGLLSAAIEVSDLFLSQGRIVSTDGRNSPVRKWDAQQPGTLEGFPIALLVNRYSASASEIVAACLQDHQRAVVIGERTWGKGSVQNIVELEGGRSALKLTTAGYMRPSGKNIHRFGDAKDGDDWGVRPNDGYEIRLSNADLSRLMTVRRERDIVRRAGEGDQPPEPPAEEEFVDAQLKKAMEYLAAQISKPTAGTKEAAANNASATPDLPARQSR
jgi:carboxyl-terminal processing protease